MFTQTKTKKLITHTYPSLTAFVAHQDATREYQDVRKGFAGVASWDECIDRATKGLPDAGLKALDASKSLANAAMRQVTAVDLSSRFDVSGSYVDMGRYVSGEPECMVDTIIETTPVTKPVVTIVMNVVASGGVPHEELTKRGKLVVALVKAIELSGRSTELWADITIANKWASATKHARIRAIVKRASAPLDMGAAMYAYTCPSMLRVLGLNAMHHLDETDRETFHVGAGYGYPAEDVHVADTYGTDVVYLSGARLGKDPEKTVTEILRELGITGT